MDLSGRWRARAATEELRRDFADPRLDTTEWANVAVPGHWRDEPDFADHDGPLFLRHHFEHVRPPEGQRTFLRFDGLFYQADIWLDGDYVGDAEGYFFAHSFEITDAVEQRTDHQLALELSCFPQTEERSKRSITGAFQASPFVHPTWNPGGIWRGVSTYETGPVPIRHYRAICTHADEHLATVALRAVLHTDEPRDVTLRTTVGDVVHERAQPLAAGENRIEWTVEITDPELWWPHALGDQPLHDLEVEVVLGDGSVSDRKRRRIGLRRVQMKNWVLSVNGTRLFLKGANVGPTRQDIGSATAEEVSGQVHAARDAGLDLLRVNAHIARPEFYAAADELGMLVWQDFPLRGGYARSVKTQAGLQAREAVDGLGHHPSIALWCGHDEPDPLPPAGPDKPFASVLSHQRPTWNRTVLDGSIKRVFEKTDGSRPVIAHSGVLPHFPQLDGTDSHLWFGWHSPRSAAVAGLIARLPRLGRFVSAFGAQSVPVTAEFAQPERWPNLDWHDLAERHGLDRETMAARVPPLGYESFEAWKRATQEYQAEVIKTNIELLRRLKYRPTGGFAQFFLADARPAVSHSLIGHDGRPKPAFQAVVDACRPVIVVADPLPESAMAFEQLRLDVHVVSDRRETVRGARVRANLTVGGEDRSWVWEGDIAADEAVKVGQVSWAAPNKGHEVILDLELTGDEVTATNRYRGYVALLDTP